MYMYVFEACISNEPMLNITFYLKKHIIIITFVGLIASVLIYKMLWIKAC